MTERKSNTKSKDFYVYLHRKATTGEVFYVGKGFGRRAKRIGDRSKYWHNIVNKHGYTIEFYATGLQEWYAFELEIQLIAYYGRENLCNLTDGGEGTSGTIPSLDSRLKMSNAQKGRKSTKETLEKIKKFHEENAKKVYCSNGMVFNGVGSAAKWLLEKRHIKSPRTSIFNALSGRTYLACGYRWSYSELKKEDKLVPVKKLYNSKNKEKIEKNTVVLEKTIKDDFAEKMKNVFSRMYDIRKNANIN